MIRGPSRCDEDRYEPCVLTAVECYAVPAARVNGQDRGFTCLFCRFVLHWQKPLLWYIHPEINDMN